MSEFIIAYRGGDTPKTPEEGAKHKESWGAWLGELGDAVVNPGTPLGQSKIVSSSGALDTKASYRLSGFTTVKADDMDAAIAMAKTCPFLNINGLLEVAEIMEMC